MRGVCLRLLLGAVLVGGCGGGAAYERAVSACERALPATPTEPSCMELGRDDLAARCDEGQGRECFVLAYVEEDDGDEELLARACQAGHARACGQILTRGGGRVGMAEDQLQAVCDRGDAQACGQLGRHLAARHPDRAVGPLTMACGEGDGAACGALARLHLEHPELPAEESAVMEALRAACDAGDAEACRMSHAHVRDALLSPRCSGRGVAREPDACVDVARAYAAEASDDQRALSLLVSACTHPPEGAAAVPPACLADRPGVADEPTEVLTMFCQACRAGQDPCCGMEPLAGRLLAEARGLCERQQIPACLRAGAMLHAGCGAPADPGAALIAFGRACDERHREGCPGVASLYRDETVSLPPPAGSDVAREPVGGPLLIVDPERFVVMDGFPAFSQERGRIAVSRDRTIPDGGLERSVVLLDAATAAEVQTFPVLVAADFVNGQLPADTAPLVRRVRQRIAAAEQELSRGYLRMRPVPDAGAPLPDPATVAPAVQVIVEQAEERVVLLRDRGPGAVRFRHSAPAAREAAGADPGCERQRLTGAESWMADPGRILVRLSYKAAPAGCPTAITYVPGPD